MSGLFVINYLLFSHPHPTQSHSCPGCNFSLSFIFWSKGSTLPGVRFSKERSITCEPSSIYQSSSHAGILTGYQRPRCRIPAHFHVLFRKESRFEFESSRAFSSTDGLVLDSGHVHLSMPRWRCSVVKVISQHCHNMRSLPRHNGSVLNYTPVFPNIRKTSQEQIKRWFNANYSNKRELTRKVK